MAIVDHGDWDLSERGKSDAARHQKKIDDHIRRNVRDAIAETPIITDRKGRKVKIPVKGLKDWRFVYGKNKGGEGGVGQGEGKPGDVIERIPKDGKDGKDGPGPPGQQPGVDYMETEVDIDYLLQIMFEDLGLPWIEEKTKAQQLVPKGWKFETISKKGVHSRIHKHRTMKEAIFRTAVFVREIIEDTGCPEEVAYQALSQAEGDLEKAVWLVKNNMVTFDTPSADIYIEDDDLRFKQIEEDIEIHSNAVLICMMDVSASMGLNKKYLARSMLFWLNEFLKKTYSHVQVKFITHTTSAKLVGEEEFFYKMESGGTNCYTAFDLANYLIDTEYPLSEWNVYCVYISDGEDFDPERTMTSINEMVKKEINMLAYTEIQLDDPTGISGWGYQNLLKTIKKSFRFPIKKKQEGTTFYKNEELRFLATVIKGKEHIYPALKWMLFERANK
jgi:sporulation protein YhbH